MSADTQTVGYPVHAVATYRKRVTENGVTLTDWAAACGAEGQLVGAMARFGRAGSARKMELCTSCWPSGDHRKYHPEPKEV
jgi:hypothetical protein